MESVSTDAVLSKQEGVSNWLDGRRQQLRIGSMHVSDSACDATSVHALRVRKYLSLHNMGTKTSFTAYACFGMGTQ